MALIIGTIELIGVLVDQAKIDSGPLVAIADIPLDYAGYAIVVLFVVTWLVALVVWRFGRIERNGPARSMRPPLRLPDRRQTPSRASILPSRIASRNA